MMGMQEFIAKIAKGPKASKDLTWDEAKRAMQALIEGDATAAQAGAFLVAMRYKMESVTELAAFTAAARSYVPHEAWLVAPRGVAGCTTRCGWWHREVWLVPTIVRISQCHRPRFVVP